MICLGNFQSRAPECEFEVNSGRLFLFSRSRAKNIYFYWRYSTGLSRFFSMGLLSRRAAIAEKTMRTRFGLVSDLPNNRRGNFIPRAFSLTISKMAVVCIYTLWKEREEREGDDTVNVILVFGAHNGPTRARTRVNAQTVCQLPLSFGANQTSFSNHFISYLLLQSTVVESLNPFLRFLRGGFTGKSRPRRRFISPVL